MTGFRKWDRVKVIQYGQIQPVTMTITKRIVGGFYEAVTSKGEKVNINDAEIVGLA